MFCSKCGTENKVGTKFCKKCGTKLENEDSQILNEKESLKSSVEKKKKPILEEIKEDKKAPSDSKIICAKCGSSNEKGMKFCRKCGTKLENEDSQILNEKESLKSSVEKKKEPILEESKEDKKEPNDSKIICAKCGSSNEKGMKFCRKCGTKLENEDSQISDEKESLKSSVEKKKEPILEEIKEDKKAPNDSKIICAKCGSFNEKGMKFCKKCGTAFNDDSLDENQLFIKNSVINHSVSPNRNKKGKRRSKWPFILILIILVVVSLGCIYFYLDKKTSPRSFIKEYMEAVSNKDYSSLYNYSSFDGDKTFIRESDYTEALKNIKYLDTVSSYEIDSIDYKDSYVEVEMDVVYETIGKKSMTIKLKKADEKEYLLFDKWVLVSNNRIDIDVVSDYKITVPKDSSITFNDIEVNKKYLDSSKDTVDVYSLPQVLSSNAKLRVSLTNGMEIVKNIVPSKESDGYKLTISKSDISSSEQEAIMEATKNDLGVLMNAIIEDKKFEEIKDNLAKNSDLSELEKTYNRYVSSLNNYKYNLDKFSFESSSIVSIKLDDDYLLKVEQKN